METASVFRATLGQELKSLPAFFKQKSNRPLEFSHFCEWCATNLQKKLPATLVLKEWVDPSLLTAENILKHFEASSDLLNLFLTEGVKYLEKSLQEIEGTGSPFPFLTAVGYINSYRLVRDVCIQSRAEEIETTLANLFLLFDAFLARSTHKLNETQLGWLTQAMAEL
jgi:hypothetical protein